MDELSSQARHLLRILKKFQGRNAKAWPKQATLAKEMGVTIRTVQRHVRELRLAGVVTVTRTKVCGINHYSVSCPDATPVSCPDATPVSCPDATPVSHVPESTISRELKAEAAFEGAAAAAPPPPPKTKTQPVAAKLEELGLAAPLAAQAAERDPRLAEVVCEVTAERLADPKQRPIRNRAGFVRSMLTRPQEFGFTRDEGGQWRRPPPEGQAAQQAAAAASREQRAAKAQIAKAQAQADEQKALAWYRHWRDVWDTLPPEEQGRIQAIVRDKLPLFGQRENIIMSQSLRILEAEHASHH